MPFGFQGSKWKLAGARTVRERRSLVFLGDAGLLNSQVSRIYEDRFTVPSPRRFHGSSKKGPPLEDLGPFTEAFWELPAVSLRDPTPQKERTPEVNIGSPSSALLYPFFSRVPLLK